MGNLKVFIMKAAERAVRTFLQGYFAFWVVTDTSYDNLFTVDNFKAGVVAMAASIAMSLGLKNVGPDKDSPSII